MPIVRLPDDSLGIKSSDGTTLPWRLGEKRAIDMGFSIPPPLTDPSRGALAENSPTAKPSRPWIALTPEPTRGIPDVASVARSALAPPPPPEKPAAPPDQKQIRADLKNVVTDPEQIAAAKAAERTAAAEGGPKLKNGASVVEAPPTGQPESSTPRPGGGGHYVPGGDVRAAYSVQRTNVSPGDIATERLADVQATSDAEKGYEQLSQSRAARVDAQAAALGEKLDAEDQAVADQAHKNQLIEAEFTRRQNEIDADNAALDKMPIQSAGEILGDRGAGTKFLSALSIALGGIAQGLGKHSQNVGLQMRDRAVDQAIAAQKEKRDARLQGLHIKETQLERLERLYGSPEAAEGALRDRMDRLFDNHAQKLLLDSGAKDEAAAYQIEAAQRQQAAAQRELGRSQEMSGKITEQFQYQPGHVVGGAPAVKESDVHQLSADEEKAGLGAEAADLGRTIDLIHSMPEGDVPTIGSRNIVSRAARGAADLVGGTGTAGALFDTPAEHAAATKVEQIRGALRHQLSGAAVSPTEAPILERQLQDLNTKEGLLQFATDMRRKIERHQAGIRAGSRPEVVQEYERRRRAYNTKSGPSSARGE
jgi:hypothetical protein